jgi:hypothetical protein
MAYVDIAELQRVLNLPSPTAAQSDAMQRCLDAAAEEIDWSLGYDPTDNPAPSPPPVLVVQVNLERAEEHWKAMTSPFGVLQLGPDVVPTFAARDSFYRHNLKLRPLWADWGVG